MKTGHDSVRTEMSAVSPYSHSGLGLPLIHYGEDCTQGHSINMYKVCSSISYEVLIRVRN